MTAKEVMEVSPIVPVIALESVEDALPLAKALLEGGISVMEITLRTEAGLGCIEAISKGNAADACGCRDGTQCQ